MSHITAIDIYVKRSTGYKRCSVESNSMCTVQITICVFFINLIEIYKGDFNLFSFVINSGGSIYLNKS